MCVSTCQVEFVLRELSCFVLLPRSRFIGCSGDFSVLKRTVQLFNYNPGGSYRKLAGTTTLAYWIRINCTTAEWVLKMVSTFWLACSSHRQGTDIISIFLLPSELLDLSRKLFFNPILIKLSRQRRLNKAFENASKSQNHMDVPFLSWPVHLLNGSFAHRHGRLSLQNLWLSHITL